MKQSKLTPTFFLTYEQLLLSQEQAISDLFCFLLDVTSIEGTIVAAKIRSVCAKDHKDQTFYALKASTGKLCARANYYSAQQLVQMDAVCRDYMHFYGYASHPRIKHATQFSVYTDQTEQELANYKQFEVLNK